MTTCQGLFTRKFAEPTKAAILKDRIAALLRSLIHILPVRFALMEIIINWNGRYVGATFDKQTLFQFIAKAHEITVQASLAVTVLSYLRRQVITEFGIPFGALLGGVQFLQISYLWSVEFWSSILSQQFRIWSKFCFFILILLCTLIAAVAGPSSATLLIPRQDSWPLKSFNLFLNATSNDIWPKVLDGEKVSKNCTLLMPPNPNEFKLGCPMDDLSPLTQPGFQFLSSYSDFSPMVLNTFEIADYDYGYSKLIISASCGGLTQHQYCSTSTQEVFAAGITDP